MARVLIVDDERLTTMALSYYLSDCGHQTFCAESGEDAIQIGTDQSLDLLIVDYSLKGSLKGSQVARELQSTHPALHILMITGFSRDDVEGDLHGLERVQVHQKPLDFDELGRIVAETVG